MPKDRNTILSPKRYSAVTHGHFAVGPRGMYFKYDHCLDPTLVYGAMLRVKLSSSLAENYDWFVCQYEADMWEARKLLPRIADRVISEYDFLRDGVTAQDPDFDRVFFVPYNGVHEHLDVTTATVDYRK